MQGTYDRNGTFPLIIHRKRGFTWLIVAMRIRTYPHICVSAAKDSIYDLPPLDLLQTEEGQEKGEGRETAESKTDKKPFLQTKLPRRECESNCWASNAMDVVLESLKNALPKVPQEHTLETAASGPQVINSGMSLGDLWPSLPANTTIHLVIEILRAYPEALHRINELERANDRLKDGIPAQKEEP